MANALAMFLRLIVVGAGILTVVSGGARFCGEMFAVDEQAFSYFIDVTSYSSLVFSFTSCSAGYVSLSSDETFPNDHLRAYELMLAHSGVQLHSCHSCASNSLLSYSPVTSFDCHTQDTIFWLAWDNDTVLVGEGSQPYTATLLWEDPLLHPVSYLGFSVQTGASATYSLFHCSSSTDPVVIPKPTRVQFNVPFITRSTLVTHALDVSKIGQLIVTLRSCSTAFMRAARDLTDVLNDDVTTNYVIKLELHWSIIKLFTVSPAPVLLDSSSLPFGGGFNCLLENITLWIKIEEGNMTMGTGTDVTSGALLTTDLIGQRMCYIGFYATAYDTPTWIIDDHYASDDSGETTTIETNTSPDSGSASAEDDSGETTTIETNTSPDSGSASAEDDSGETTTIETNTSPDSGSSSAAPQFVQNKGTDLDVAKENSGYRFVRACIPVDDTEHNGLRQTVPHLFLMLSLSVPSFFQQL